MTMDMSLDIGNQFLQVLAAVDPQPAAALIDVGLDDLDLSLGGISGDRRGLVLSRVFLLIRGHTNILRGLKASQRLITSR